MRGKLWAVLAAIGLAAVLAGGSALAAAAGDNNKDTTITVVVKTFDVRVVDLGPKGPTHGDLRVFNNDRVYNKEETKVIGRADGFCAVTDPTARQGLLATECLVTWSLPGGEITVQTVNFRPALKQLPREDLQAVTGGTGTYKGAKGEARLLRQGDKLLVTFHLIS